MHSSPLKKDVFPPDSALTTPPFFSFPSLSFHFYFLLVLRFPVQSRFTYLQTHPSPTTPAWTLKRIMSLTRVSTPASCKCRRANCPMERHGTMRCRELRITLSHNHFCAPTSRFRDRFFAAHSAALNRVHSCANSPHHNPVRTPSIDMSWVMRP